MITQTPIQGIKHLNILNHSDTRGSFSEIQNVGILQSIGVKQIVQTNFLVSYLGAIRGLHAQLEPFSQCKLLMVSKGEIFDVVLDLRENSPTYLMMNFFRISQNDSALFVPSGCLHGFQSLSEESHVIYQTDVEYKPENQFGINPLDGDINIPWPIEKKIVSFKDKNLPSLREFLGNA